MLVKVDVAQRSVGVAMRSALHLEMEGYPKASHCDKLLANIT